MVVMNELKMLSIPSRILLFIMFLHGRYLVKLSAINEQYNRAQHLVKDELGLPFMSLLSSELSLQKSRIEKIGTKKQALRFVHPMYEEAIGESNDIKGNPSSSFTRCWALLYCSFIADSFTKYLPCKNIIKRRIREGIDNIFSSFITTIRRLLLLSKEILSQNCLFVVIVYKLPTN
jgi:hypothetical protein